MSSELLRIGGLRLSVNTLIYGTILVTVSLSVYENEDPGPMSFESALEIISVVLGTLAAVALAHILADTAHAHIRAGRFPHRPEFARIWLLNMQYLYVAVVPTLIVLICLAARTPAETPVVINQVVGVLSLVGWGILAGSATGRRTALLYGLAYGILGAAIVVTEALLTH